MRPEVKGYNLEQPESKLWMYKVYIQRCIRQSLGGIQTWSSFVAQTHYPPGIDMQQYIWSIAHQGSSSETHCPEFLLGLHYVYMTDWLITHLVELSLQANWYHVTQAFPPYSHGWVLVWPASALNCDLPSRVDIGYLPEIEGKGHPSLWTRSNSLLDTLDRSIMTNLWEWGLKELQPYSALWWLPCCCFLLWLWAVKFQDYPLEEDWEEVKLKYSKAHCSYWNFQPFIFQ